MKKQIATLMVLLATFAGFTARADQITDSVTDKGADILPIRTLTVVNTSISR